MGNVYNVSLKMRKNVVDFYVLHGAHHYNTPLKENEY